MYQLDHDRLKEGNNNLWYRCNSNRHVLVFVHGIFADSRSCWAYKPQGNKPIVFWPDLIQTDSRLPKIDIFLGGFFTATDAGEYGIDDCASELYGGMARPDEHGNPLVMSYERIIFVCHSTGGIVARYVLEHYRKSFRDKKIGLVLIASPSDGSELANLLGLLANLYRNKLGQQLKWRNWSLDDLDKRFKNLVHEPDREFALLGTEAYENKFIIHRKWLPDVVRVVNAESAGKYFKAPRHLPNTDHFSAVKPDTLNHPSHQLLVDFVREFQEWDGKVLGGDSIHAKELADRLGKILDPAQVFAFEAAPTAAAAKLSLPTRSVINGLNALNQLMSEPTVQAAVVAFQTDFRAACEEIHVLGDYKDLHDSFQVLQDRYRVMDENKKCLPADQTAWDRLTGNEPDLQGAIDKLLRIAGRASFASDEAVWMDQLKLAGKELQAAIENSDWEQLKTFASRLNRVLTRQPSRINHLLFATAKRLHLSAVVEALRTARDSLDRSRLDPEGVSSFGGSVDALARLDDSLKGLVSEHNSWQGLDDELLRVENNLGQDLNELKIAWPDLKTMTQKLCGGITDDWAMSLNSVMDKLENALATGHPRARTLFVNYRSQVSRHFNIVDVDLKHLSEELRRVGDPLTQLLEKMR